MMSALLLSLSFVGILKSVLLFLFFACALLLVLIILLQEPKGGGLAAAFGGAGAETFGVQSGGVNKFTAYLAGAFMVLAVLYASIRPATDEEVTPTDRGAPALMDTEPEAPPEGAEEGGEEGE